MIETVPGWAEELRGWAGLMGYGQVSPLPYFFRLSFIFYFLFQLSNLNSNLLAGFLNLELLLK
jgi:hypothetical protein